MLLFIDDVRIAKITVRRRSGTERHSGMRTIIDESDARSVVTGRLTVTLDSRVRDKLSRPAHRSTNDEFLVTIDVVCPSVARIKDSFRFYFSKLV